MPHLLTTLWLLLVAGCAPALPPTPADLLYDDLPTTRSDAQTLRVATYNIEDVWTRDVLRDDHPRLEAAARRIQQVRPDILLWNEVAYDAPGRPDVPPGAEPGQNAQRFADRYLSVPQGEGLAPLRYRALMLPVNTGVASGYDLDRSGETVTLVPPLKATPADGSAPPQSPEGRAYGGDAWGFGVYPGQYGLALLVREDLDIVEDEVRTFQLFPWAGMPGALLPMVPGTDEPWYDGEAAERFRLSSKTHADIPVALPSGDTLHVLASHPTPPAFDGPEDRNKRRNYDEIRLWADYLSGADYLVDDQGRTGGLPDDAPFVLLGDLNADPDEGNTYGNPMRDLLLAHPRVQDAFVPTASAEGQDAFPDLDPDDTARWGRRVDYVLPSDNLEVLGGQVVRPTDPDAPAASDHFLVWLDVAVE